jgi:hypothetical protein
VVVTVRVTLQLMSATPTIAISKEILHDPERKQKWQERYDEAQKKARRLGKPIQGRLCDYVRHEVSLALKEGREIE